MGWQSRPVIVLFVAFLGLFASTVHAQSLMLAQNYDAQDVAGWLASEKLDGVRGYWTGDILISRQNKRFYPPAGFTEGFPPFALDGELYMGPGQFADTSGKIRKGEHWSGIKLHVFDVPEAKGGLLMRLEKIRQWLTVHPEANIAVIEQVPVHGITEAQAMLDQIMNKGGEGVILRDPNAPYLRTRSKSMLKLKRWQDDECTITAHLPGKGKYQGLLGAVECRWLDGQIIRLGSGFSDAERAAPPPVGQVVSFRYHGLTKYGKPRFATFWRIRNMQ
ncbi:MAG: DNA ligase [Parahaliea sp.]